MARTMQVVHERKKYQQVSAETIEGLKEIANRHGGVLQAEDVVSEARKASSPLHSRFEWDNTEAAERYRLIQARFLISISVEVVRGSRIATKAFVSLTTDRYTGGGYRIATTVMSDDQMRQQMLEDALENMESFRQKYQRLRELSRVIQYMREAGREIRNKTHP